MIKNINHTRGDTLAFGFTYDEPTQDLDTCYFTIKEHPEDETILVQKKLNDGITKVDTGSYRVRVAPEDTKNLNLGTYYYDLEVGINSDVYTLLKGQLELTYDVTRSDD